MTTKSISERYDECRERQNGSMWFSQKSLEDGLDWREHIAHHFYIAGDSAAREEWTVEREELLAIRADIERVAELILTTGYTELNGNRVMDANEYVWLDHACAILRKYFKPADSKGVV